MRKKTSKHVTLRNVRNLVAKLKEARRGSTTVESRLEAGLRRFYSRKGFTATIYVDDDKLAQTHVPDSSDSSMRSAKCCWWTRSTTPTTRGTSC
ncbi:hypothetical protein PC129_g20494 [Phytophthora cactorum]|uniref:Uncharacterized protein n=1 Tax=Phytophthora cactorum TaxID=29920 RepID=A0A329S084_9STRA|nr:hypothetical protein Pcac1_g1132 [Phytophthora cactorum]KAG2825687.1 hypothetical protein PC113_g21869 [Phytophthora cactorum]KAG2875992.1 hypothetical protein PC114_g24427 [Phytophthora cactorum]KAG2942018.1 hypothetical protein PC117_g9988 [Phytophthora cactorum]KAG2969093.1 hypothetical protein PC119_g24037 [Phytophthora cactorum]